MKEQLSSAYMARLFYQTAPHIDGGALLHALQTRCGDVVLLSSHPDVLLYAFPRYLARYQGGSLPAQIMLTPPNAKGKPEALEEAIQQSWGWHEAGAAIEACNASLALSDMMASGLAYKERIDLFHYALESVLSLAPCAAIHWVASQQIVNPAAYLAARAQEPHPMQFALNVRFYSIRNRQEGEMLMDTMGLSAFGLPDLQCHFVDLDPDDVARVLYNTACYLFDSGDVIQDGHTIQGAQPSDRWRCQREDSLVGPDRVVIDVNPGEPYAAGERG